MRWPSRVGPWSPDPGLACGRPERHDRRRDVAAVVLRGVTTKVEFVAGFGPIARSGPESLAFWSGSVGVPFEEASPGYFATDDLPGTMAFAIWPLEQAAESTVGTSTWPAEHPVPQAWVELDVATPEEVAVAVTELEAAGCTILRGAQEEPWGQTTSRLLSPESLLVGISHTPWMHA